MATQIAQRSDSLDASVAIRSKISLTNELRIDMALFEIPVSSAGFFEDQITGLKRYGWIS